MLKKIALFLFIFSVLISCNEKELNTKENKEGISNSLSENSSQGSDILVNETDVDIDPSVPILSDAELLSNSPLSSIDKKNMEKIFKNTVDDQKNQLKSSLDFSSLTVNYFNIDDFDPSALVSTQSVGPLKIVDYGPEGELPIEVAKPTIYVLFNQAMVPLSKLGEPMTSTTLMEISPQVKGKFRWMGTKMLTFEPDEAIFRVSDYKITIKKEGKSIFGKQLPRDFEFVFHNEPVEVVSYMFGTVDDPYDSHSEIPPQQAKSILLTFNQTVEAENLKDFIEVHFGSEQYTVQVKAAESSENLWNEHRLQRTVHVLVKEDLPFNRKITIKILPGAQANKDSSPRESIQELKYSTLSEFKYKNHRNYSYNYPYDPDGVQNPIYIEFSHPIDKETVLFNLKTNFQGLDLEKHIQVFDKTIRLSGLPVSYGSEYEVTLIMGLKDIYGRELSRDKTLSVEVPQAAQYSQFPGSNGLRTLEAEFDPKLVYEYQNITDGLFYINNNKQDPGFNESKPNEANYKLVDLTPYLNDKGFGQTNLLWEFTESYLNWENERVSWVNKRNMDVQVTDLAITTRYSYNKFLIWINKISTGEPVNEADIVLKGKMGTYASTQTDIKGFVSIDLNPGDMAKHFFDSTNRNYIINISAEKNDDRADLPVRNTHSGWRFGIENSSPIYAEKRIARVFIFSDRGLYKPGETITFRGMDWDQYLGDFIPYVGPYSIKIEEIRGYNSKVIKSWSGNTSDSGGFFDSYKIAKDQDPIDLKIVYEREGKKFIERVKVAYFRRLNFQAFMKTPDRNYFIGDKISIPLEASYLAGGALAEGEISSYWTRKPVIYRPAGEKWRHSVFGPSVGWLHENVLSSHSDKLSLQGTALLSTETIDHSLKAMAYRYVIEATVEDIDRQTVSAATSVLVHPSSYYIAASIEDNSVGRWRRFVPVDKQIKFAFYQVDIEGNLYDFRGKAQIEVIKGSYKAVQQNSIGGRVNTRYEWIEETLQTDEINWKTSKSSYKYTPQVSGSYRFRISSLDKKDRKVITDLELYVSGGSWVRWASNNAEDITLEVEQELYFPGDKARILVKSPLEKGQYLLTIEREGIIDEKIITLTPSDSFIEIDVEEDWIPVMYITLSSFLTRTAQPNSYFDPDFGKPKGIFGAATINISTKSRELDIEVKSDKAVYLPGEKGLITVKVSQNGLPVKNTEITYLAVDRGILDLINYHIPNPIDYFYNPNHFQLYGSGDDSRRLLLTPVTYDVKNLTGGDGDEGKLKRRDDFTPLAVFEPFLKTDDQGEVQIEVEWPDTLTTYRSTVIALKGDKIGYLENELFVKNPINVRAALPRQMRTRDTSFAGVILTNIDSLDHEVTVKIESDLLGLPGDTTKTVLVPAGRSYEVPFLLEGKETGEGQVLFTINSKVLNEELVQKIKVEKPIIKESFTTIGIVGDDEEFKEEALLIPQSIGESYGSLSLSIDSSQAPFLREQLQQLHDHRVYDNTFDYIYKAFPAILAPELIKEMGRGFEKSSKDNVKSLVALLKNRQNNDGGIATSRHSMGYYSHPYCSLLSFHMILLLKEQKSSYQSAIDLSKLVSFLKKYSRDNSSNQYFNLYLHYLLTMKGEINKDKTDEFKALEDNLGISGYALLAYTYELEGRSRELNKVYKKIKNFVSMGAQSVDIRETYESRYYFDSMYQQLSHLLRLAVKNGEEPEIISRYTFSLNQNKNSRNWVNSQDRMWMAIALSDLITAENPGKTKYEGSVVLNENILLKSDFEGYSKGPEEKDFDLFKEIIPMSPMNTLSSLQFRKSGNGKLFYRSTLKYALPNEVAMMRDEGLSVYSQIEDMEGEVIKNNELSLGDTYRMRVLINTNKNRRNVNLTVPIPSGAEIVDPSFSTTSSFINQGGVNSEKWSRESQYGDEVEYIGEGYIIGGYFYPFTPNQLIFNQEIRYAWDNLYHGQREITFLFRCTTPGIYPTPPASAELLFEPEVFGRDKGRLIVIH